MQSTFIVLAALALSGPLDQPAAKPATPSATAPAPVAATAAQRSSSMPIIDVAHVTTIADVQVPAQEPGVLVQLGVVEGQEVKEGELLGKIDATQAEFARDVAILEHQGAEEKAQSDAEVKFAIAATEVAAAEYEKAREAVRKVPGSISQAELNRLKLSHKKAYFQIDLSERDQRIAKITSQSKAVEARAAEANIKRRQIMSPLDGMVVKIERRAGEWVQPGDPVLQILRLDKLWVEGDLSISEFSPHQVRGRPVAIEVQLAGGRPERFYGKVVFVDPQISPGGRYLVKAEVENRQENGQWLLLPGMVTQMAIDLNGPVDAARSVTANQQ